MHFGGAKVQRPDVYIEGGEVKNKTAALEKFNAPEFVARLRAGEETAFREFDAAFFVSFTAYAEREFAMSKEDAKDLAQETLIAVSQKIKLFDPQRGHLFSWAFRILRNRCVDWMRKRKRLPAFVPTETILESLIQEELAARRDNLSELERLPSPVREAILRLPGRYQQFIGLRLTGVADEYIMQVLQIKTRANLRSLKSRAYAKLRAEIQKQRT